MKPTESPSPYRHLERRDTATLLSWINAEDRRVAEVVGGALPAIARVVDAVAAALRGGHRLFYIGAGTSGRLGVVDASECPPTFGVPPELVTGLIAGGDGAIREAVEGAEDDAGGGWRDLRAAGAEPGDVVVGLAASGTTPYVVGGLRDARGAGLVTACVTCNPDTPVAAACALPIEVVTGPEFVTGSTRLKAGTAQKMVLNMITTAAMIRLGRVEDNRMVDMALSNDKLWARGVRMLRERADVTEADARALLREHGSVRAAAAALRRGEARL